MGAPPGYPMGPVPMPYMPAVIVKPETVSGIRTYQISLVLDIVFSIFALMIGLSGVLIATSDVSGAFSLAAILGASVCGILIVFVINFIVSLMSVTKMHHGASEYGAEHAKNATRGVVFKWMGTAFSIAAVVLVVYLVIFGAFLFSTGTTVPPTAYVPLLVTVFWTAGVTCKGQMYRHMVRSLQPPELATRTLLASILIPALGIVGISVVGYFTVRFIGGIQNPGSITPLEAAQLAQVLIGGVFLPPGFALVGYILFLSAYLRTSARLSQGLAQVQAAMPMWPMYSPGIGVPPPGTAPPPPDGNPAPPPPPPPGGATAQAVCSQCGRPVSTGAVFCMNC